MHYISLPSLFTNQWLHCTRELRRRLPSKLPKKDQMYFLEWGFGLVRGFLQIKHLLELQGQSQASPNLIQIWHQVISMCHLHPSLMMAPKLLWKAISVTMFLITVLALITWMQSDLSIFLRWRAWSASWQHQHHQWRRCYSMPWWMPQPGQWRWCFFTIILLDLIHKLIAFLLPAIFRWIYPAWWQHHCWWWSWLHYPSRWTRPDDHRRWAFVHLFAI